MHLQNSWDEFSFHAYYKNGRIFFQALYRKVSDTNGEQIHHWSSFPFYEPPLFYHLFAQWGAFGAMASFKTSVNLEGDFKSSTFGLNFSMDGLKAEDKFQVWLTILGLLHITNQTQSELRYIVKSVWLTFMFWGEALKIKVCRNLEGNSKLRELLFSSRRAVSNNPHVTL